MESTQIPKDLIHERTIYFIGDIYADAVKHKISELFGQDTYAYLDQCIEKKQGIDPAKINALQEYIRNLTDVFQKTYEIT